MSNAIKYEYFIRRAFGDVNRGGDPASFAEADYFNLSYSETYLNKVKIGTGYAMGIFNSNYVEAKELVDPDDYIKMDAMLEKILKASAAADVENVIDEYLEFEKHVATLPDRC